MPQGRVVFGKGSPTRTSAGCEVDESFPSWVAGMAAGSDQHVAVTSFIWRQDLMVSVTSLTQLC